MSTVLVTGGAGFIGSHLVDALIARKHRVIVVDDLSVGTRRSIPRQALFYKVDITKQGITRVFQKHRIDVIYHLAAQKNLQVSKKDPIRDAEINILGSVRLFALARAHAVQKVIFYSTAAVYRPTDTPPNSERDCPEPATPYGIAKYTAEQYLQRSEVPYTILRLANVYGPGQDAYGEGGVVAVFSSQMAQHKACTIYNTGRQTRDYIFVGDVITASLAALRKGTGDVLNISTGKETSVTTLHRKLQEISHTAIAPKRKRIDEQRRSALSPRRAQQRLGWHARTQLDKGLLVTYEWFLKHYGETKKNKR